MDIYNKISLQELNEQELEYLNKNGHLGYKTRNIAELQHFYNALEEENKRRNLKHKYILDDLNNFSQ